MSVVDTNGEKIVVRCNVTSEFLRGVAINLSNEHNALRDLAVYTLSLSGWRIEDIGQVFGMAKGHISRIVKRVDSDLERMRR